VNDAKKPKASISEIYALIDSDLQYAAANLPPKSYWATSTGQSKFPGRLTKSAAWALSAKTHLYRGSNNAAEWSTALGLCQQVFSSGDGYGLESKFSTVFSDAGENGIESIYEIQANIGANGADNYGAPNPVHQGVRGAGEWDLGWGWNTPTKVLVTAWADNDPRKNASILFSGQSDGAGRTLPPYPSIPREYWNKKVYPSQTMQSYTGNRQGGWINQRVIRYADVLLMAAEAANEVGGATNAKLAEDWLEQLRSKRREGGDPATVLPKVVFVDKAQMRTAIQNERRFELALEGERFFDLVRWNLATTVLGPLGYLNKHRFLPLPQPAIDLSGGVLVQNPEWP
jgi:starch-binding outer membrane protein, SusD/RagB family